jgi:hypothetical protein
VAGQMANPATTRRVSQITYYRSGG